MKVLPCCLSLLPLLGHVRAAFSELHPPRLAGYYAGTLNGNLPIHAYFFATTKDLEGIVEGYYRYGQRKQMLHLAGAYCPPDSRLPRNLPPPRRRLRGARVTSTCSFAPAGACAVPGGRSRAAHACRSSCTR
ncbi:hypothetical protein GCM10027422_43740 [Hymenobacter arcticus]